MPAVALRRFQVPPRALNDLGGPPPLDLGAGIPYGDGAELTPPGPPPLDRELLLYPQLQAANPVPLEQREDLAMNSPTADWMFEPYQPTEQELQTRPPLQGRPGERPGGLRRALAKILPIARDLAMSTAAGANEPTAIGGLGAGIAQNEAQQQARRSMELKAIHDWQKMQVEAAKTQAEIEKMGAETVRGKAEAEKARKETELLPGREESQAALRSAQAAASRDLGTWNQARTKAEQALLAAGEPAARVKERSARAANYEMENRWIQEGLDSGLRRTEAELNAAQRRRQLAEAQKAEAETAGMPEENARKKLMADAMYQNSVAAMQRAAALLQQQGQLRPADLVRAEAAYDTARSRILAARANELGDKSFYDQQLADLERRHQALQQEMRRRQTPAMDGGPPALPAPGGGAPVNPYR